MLVVYEGRNETLITTAEDEHILRKRYFEDGGRNFDDYDRSISSDVLEVNSNVRVRSDNKTLANID